MSTTLQQAAQNTFDNLTGVLSSLSQEQIDTVPAPGRWSAGQVAEHIVKSASGFTGFFNQDPAPAQRPADEKIGALRDLFLNRDIKMQSPESILPTAAAHPREELINTLKGIGEELSSVAGNMDLNLVCNQVDFPGFGHLTRLEWLNFALFHTQRHTEQIKETIQAL